VKRPVLILGFIPRIVVTIARSLHRHGVAVDVADFVFASRIRSNAIRNFVRLPYAATDPVGFVNQLRSFITLHGHDLLIPTDDSALSALVEHYDDFKDLLHIACPHPDIAGLVLNKASTLEIAQKCGVRIPKTVLVLNSAQLPELVPAIPFPWILKPSAKRQGTSSRAA
jgi:predicted ATP-grasp superfamily ATP-dependent carboligase